MSVRPTSDRVREALFSIIGERVVGARVLDLYAGAGTLGIEALSRGAAEATFVERSPRTAAAIHENLARCGMSEKAAVRLMDVAKYLVKAAEDRRAYDLIFLDPPYRISNAEVEDSLTGLVEGGFLAGHALVVLERPARVPAANVASLSVKLTRTYGDTAVTLFEKRAVGEG